MGLREQLWPSLKRSSSAVFRHAACRALAEQAARAAARQSAVEARMRAAAIQAAAAAQRAEVQRVQQRADEAMARAQARAREEVQRMYVSHRCLEILWLKPQPLLPSKNLT